MSTRSNWKIHFSLSEEIDCNDDLPSRNDVEFDTTVGKANQKSITGFNVIVNNVTEEEAKQSSISRVNVL